MRCSKLRYYSDLELASTSKKIYKDEFFQGALNCRFTVCGTVVIQTQNRRSIHNRFANIYKLKILSLDSLNFEFSCGGD